MEDISSQVATQNNLDKSQRQFLSLEIYIHPYYHQKFAVILSHVILLTIPSFFTLTRHLPHNVWLQETRCRLPRISASLRSC